MSRLSCRRPWWVTLTLTHPTSALTLLTTCRLRKPPAFGSAFACAWATRRSRQPVGVAETFVRPTRPAFAGAAPTVVGSEAPPPRQAGLLPACGPACCLPAACKAHHHPSGEGWG